MKRHHIIIINPDEMRWDSMGHTGSPAAHTPFIDEFVSSEAVSFDRAYCQNPVCLPKTLLVPSSKNNPSLDSNKLFKYFFVVIGALIKQIS